MKKNYTYCRALSIVNQQCPKDLQTSRKDLREWDMRSIFEIFKCFNFDQQNMYEKKYIPTSLLVRYIPIKYYAIVNVNLLSCEEP